jgi:hypothetical protein
LRNRIHREAVFLRRLSGERDMIPPFHWEFPQRKTDQ